MGCVNVKEQPTTINENHLREEENHGTKKGQRKLKRAKGPPSQVRIFTFTTVDSIQTYRLFYIGYFSYKCVHCHLTSDKKRFDRQNWNVIRERE